MAPTRSNHLLARLLGAESSLAPEVSEVEHGTGHQFLRPGTAAQHVLFPSGGVLSLVARTQAGAQVEVSAVGLEGLIGLPPLLGMRRTPFVVMQQVPGRVQLMPVQALRDVASSVGAVRDLIERYAAFRLTMAHVLISCNAVHGALARTARWILMTADRAGSDDYFLTQELLAMMLGVSRPFMSRITSRFKAAGLIDYRRGHMSVLRRDRLEHEACDCYRIINKHYREVVAA